MKAIRFIGAMLILAVLTPPRPCGAGVLMTRSEALALAFPNAERVETRTLYLSAAQQAKVARLAGSDTGLLATFYVGHRGEEITGYAVIEATTVRTRPATVLILIDPQGRVRRVEILAFFEPEEYRPAARWLEQFDDHGLSPDLRIGGDIQGITGATLSAQAVTRLVRKTLALWSILTEGD
ncbi:FMN-binding protein [Geothermobacter ehrlichii]|uniref:FMN-binding protein n=1 Tax=Geothermobacter ehrlichii TaxID=213224 RepID=A0A5D3WME9_9BACT|nr:FMN-binding protein [Geothermobacter ehrlichii]TYO99669.1 FMN-binding protein [Geothermobacter ehrlichii]